MVSWFSDQLKKRRTINLNGFCEIHPTKHKMWSALGLNFGSDLFYIIHLNDLVFHANFLNVFCLRMIRPICQKKTSIVYHWKSMHFLNGAMPTK